MLRVNLVACAVLAIVQAQAAVNPAAGATLPADPNRYLLPPPGAMSEKNIERALHYHPDGTDFVVENGGEFFNRPLYGVNAFRADAGDRPEFAFYLPGRGGNLRLGIRVGNQAKWLHTADQVVARYRPGSMIYEIRDPLLGAGALRVTALPLADAEGLIVRVELDGTSAENITLISAYGGANGDKGRRNVDIGSEPVPVSQWFQLQPKYCAESQFTITGSTFLLKSKPGTMGGFFSGGTKIALGSAADWDEPVALAAGAAESATPVAVALSPLSRQSPAYIVLKRSPAADESAPDFAAAFDAAEKRRRAIAETVVVNTPDPFINAAAPALCVAADEVWDDKVGSWLHGGVAWRVPLLGWRGDYIGDALGWHDRSRRFFNRWAARQNTNAIPAQIPAPEESANLSRNETALHSNGDMSGTHYDMNLVYVDALFRHLRWTGDLEYARQMWPTIERHIAWERRLFRREFTSASGEKLPLYEAYCCIWASDDLAYNGGGATHSSAYNIFHNRMAARVAKLIGEDAKPYEREAELIAKGMKEHLWLADRGWFAEWKDLLGLQLVHPNAAVWTFYHTLDSEVPSAQEAWQMTRFVDTQIARFPIRIGDRQSAIGDAYTLPTSSWMPYTWSLNNVVMAETMHTSLGYWQANRAEAAFPIFKGAVLDSMYLGLCPGNVGMCSWFDMARRESQRDFADGCGTMSRTLVEGLFGVKPDLLAGEVTLRPGFPAEWNHASIRHPDFEFSFKRDGLRETYEFNGSFTQPVRLKLEAAALCDRVAGVTVNGKPAQWRVIEDSVGVPRIVIQAVAAEKQTMVIEWRGKPLRSGWSAAVLSRSCPVAGGHTVAEDSRAPGELVVAKCDGEVLAVSDPQQVLDEVEIKGDKLSGRAKGTAGHRTVFAQVRRGDLKWWQPVQFELRAEAAKTNPMDWSKPLTGNFETVDLAPYFNDPVTQIFKNEYRAPRSPFVSLAMPKQGFGSWCHPKDTFEVDDSGLRQLAARNDGKIILPNGVTLATPGAVGAKNIAFVSQWENYPREISVPLAGKSSHAFLLMAGSTDAMKSRFDNGEVVVTYTDGSTARLALHNPTTWWPIDQDYYIDDFAFARPEPLPPRVDLKTGQIRVLKMEEFKGKGRVVPGGAATVLDLPLDAGRELKSLTVRAIANEVVIGLMGVTLQRP